MSAEVAASSTDGIAMSDAKVNLRKRKTYSLSDKLELVKEFFSMDRSVSQTQFCTEKNISPSSFSEWKIAYEKEYLMARFSAEVKKTTSSTEDGGGSGSSKESGGGGGDLMKDMLPNGRTIRKSISINEKISVVQEYVAKEGSISQRKFCLSKNISTSTFSEWKIAYMNGDLSSQPKNSEQRYRVREGKFVEVEAELVKYIREQMNLTSDNSRSNSSSDNSRTNGSSSSSSSYNNKKKIDAGNSLGQQQIPLRLSWSALAEVANSIADRVISSPAVRAQFKASDGWISRLLVRNGLSGGVPPGGGGAHRPVPGLIIDISETETEVVV